MAKALRVRRGDMVEVTAGKDAGKIGKVIRVEPAKRRVYVEHLNIVKRHQRPTSVKDTQRSGQVGGVIEKEGPIHVSNVMVIDPTSNRPTRIGIERKNGKRVRIARKSGQPLE